jgi:hypothetical protein
MSADVYDLPPLGAPSTMPPHGSTTAPATVIRTGDRIVAGGYGSTPDDLTDAQTSALESRAEVESLDELHHRRRAIVDFIAPLKALHGPFGTWDAKRKQLLEALKVRHRMDLSAQGVKVTEAMVDAYAHADEQYARFLDESEAGKIDYIRTQTRLDEIDERIRSREIGLLAFNAEMRLAR